jgi:hypothetical protein
MVLFGALGIVVAGLVIDVDQEGTLSVVGAPSLKLPVVCPLRRYLGIPCPACGLSRSVTHLLHGRPLESLATHRLGWMLLLGLLIQIPYRIWCLAGRKAWLDHPPIEDLMLAIFFILIVLNWLVLPR